MDLLHLPHNITNFFYWFESFKCCTLEDNVTSKDTFVGLQKQGSKLILGMISFFMGNGI